MLVDVSELIEDPDFASEYTVLRRTGKWIDGRFKVSEPEQLAYYGAVQPVTKRDLEQLDIGDRKKGVMMFFCMPPKDIYETQNLDENGGDADIRISDEIEFGGYLYKVLHVNPWTHHGFTQAFASLKGGAPM